MGETTAIAAISDEALVQTDASASDMTLDRKRNTTVAMDYGAISL
ncbi:GTP-binding protein, partial [Neisseria meningitidis]|nr:GTP-binding protein [Neisseria meningitidis]